MKNQSFKTQLMMLSFALVISLFVVTSLTSCEKKNANEGAVSPVPAGQVSGDAPEKPTDNTVREEPTDSTVGVESSEMPEDAEAENTAPEQKEKLTPVYMGMWGGVGGTGFLFDMDGITGSYIPYDIAEAKEYGARRQLKLVSYDPKSGRCVINAFLKGKYIGQFDGEFFDSEEEDDEGHTHAFQSYNGIFKSVKGAKLDFHFHFD